MLMSHQVSFLLSRGFFISKLSLQALSSERSTHEVTVMPSFTDST